MKDTTKLVILPLERMEALLEPECIINCTPVVSTQLPRIIARLCKSLETREVISFIRQAARIGDTFALVDNVNGYTYRVFRSEEHLLRLLEIYENRSKPAENINAIYFLNWRLSDLISANEVTA